MTVRTRTAFAAVAALFGLAAAVSGCGATAPRSLGPPVVPAVAEAQTRHEYPSRAPPQRAWNGRLSAVAAVAAFAEVYINWDARTVARRLRRLAGSSVGQARAAMQLAAAQTNSDYELQRGGIANHGTVEAVAALADGRDRYVVVTREFTTATATNAYQGLQPAWHVTIATVLQERPGRWVVSGWQPES